MVIDKGTLDSVLVFVILFSVEHTQTKIVSKCSMKSLEFLNPKDITSALHMGIHRSGDLTLKEMDSHGL